MRYKAILIHPPATYDFRKRVVFSGPLGYTVGESTSQFMIPAVGLLSIAEYLQRNGFEAYVDNICERMVKDSEFDVESYIEELEADVYGISLHWCVHSQGAIEIANLIKKLHPESRVILGGLTSTVFADEIVEKCKYIDGVIRGEGEKPFVEYMRVIESGTRHWEEVPNLTYRGRDGKSVTNPLMKPDCNLDEYEFTRIDLLKPNGVIFSEDMPPHWMIPICRGCTHNCVSCGGSAYSYRKYLGRRCPAFRNPHNVAEDINKLGKQGIKLIFLFQDPRMGGDRYWRELFQTLKVEINQEVRISAEIFGPADEEYIKALSEIGVPVTLTISPESGVDSVRTAHGRNYTTEDILQTAILCKQYGITIGIHMMIALASDTRKTIMQTWKTWERICEMDKKSHGNTGILYAFGPMILLDPGSKAFDRPDANGYKLIFSNFEDYYKGLSMPSWDQWMSYETKKLCKKDIVDMILKSLEFSTRLRERYGKFTKEEADEAIYNLVTVSRTVLSATKGINL
jgi:B12-binding domain/radical SAM domain protein